MPICEPKQLSAQIRKGELQNLYYIYGADLVQVDVYKRQASKIEESLILSYFPSTIIACAI